MTNRASHLSQRTRRYVGLYWQVFRREHFLQRVGHCADHESHKIKLKTNKSVGLTNFPWNAHRVGEYNHVVLQARFFAWTSCPE